MSVKRKKYEIPTKRILNFCDQPYSFIIPSYQRGYRWTSREVDNLLDDLLDHASKGSKDGYVLQPLMVAGGGPWRVIDGQQRLTTILILFYYARCISLPDLPAHFYRISYQTRAGDRDFLNLYIAGGKLAAKRMDYGDLINKFGSILDSIDTYHMLQTWNAIADRIGKKETTETNAIIHAALHARVIWYVIGEGENSKGSITTVAEHGAFARANTGKIRLTGGELVKAVYLKHANDSKAAERTALQLTHRWDELERQLHDGEFWGFLAPTNTSDTRIDLLLRQALEVQNLGSDQDAALDLFYYYDELSRRDDGSLEQAWQSVKHHARVLDDWYRKTRIYHRVGFLHAIRKTVVPGSIKEKSWSRLEAKLNDRIRAYLKKAMTSEERIVPLENLLYGEHSELLKHLLLLFSILEEEQVGRRFPFSAFNISAMGDWSLEHITAQNEEALLPGMHRGFLENLRSYIKTLPDVESSETKKVIKDIGSLLKALPELDEETQGTKFSDLMEMVNEALPDLGLQLHTIDNLALLHRRHNSSLSNAFFPEKRRIIMELWTSHTDKKSKSPLVPLSTIRTFSKAYYDEGNGTEDRGNLNLGVWVKQDRDTYLKRLADVLGTFLPGSDSEAEE